MLPLLLLLPLPGLQAQSSFGSGHVTLETPLPLRVKTGATAPLGLRFRLAAGHHTNSNKPTDEFLIPLKLTWDLAASPPLAVMAVEYPAGKLEKYAFSEKPLSVYSGEFVVTTRFKVAADAPKGQQTVNGKLRYQACSDTMCFPPRTLTVQANVVIQ